MFLISLRPFLVVYRTIYRLADQLVNTQIRHTVHN